MALGPKLMGIIIIDENTRWHLLVALPWTIGWGYICIRQEEQVIGVKYFRHLYLTISTAFTFILSCSNCSYNILCNIDIMCQHTNTIQDYFYFPCFNNYGARNFFCGNESSPSPSGKLFKRRSRAIPEAFFLRIPKTVVKRIPLWRRRMGIQEQIQLPLWNPARTQPNILMKLPQQHGM